MLKVLIFLITVSTGPSNIQIFFRNMAISESGCCANSNAIWLYKSKFTVCTFRHGAIIHDDDIIGCTAREVTGRSKGFAALGWTVEGT